MRPSKLIIRLIAFNFAVTSTNSLAETRLVKLSLSMLPAGNAAAEHDALSSNSALVTRVAPSTPAKNAGLRPGDAVLEVDEVPGTSDSMTEQPVVRTQFGNLHFAIHHFLYASDSQFLIGFGPSF